MKFSSLKLLCGLLACLLAFTVINSAQANTISLTASGDQIQLLSNTDDGITVRYDFSSIESFDVQTKMGAFTQLNIPGFSHNTKIGSPKLPVMRKLISVPLGAEVNASVTRFNTETFTLASRDILNPILPAQPSLRKDQSQDDVPFIYDQAAYSRTTIVDRPQVRVEELGILRGMRLFALTVEPVAYDPVTQSLTVFNGIEVRADFIGSDLAATSDLRRTTFSPYFESAYSQSVLNYRSENSLDNDLVTYPVRYMIISDPMFADQLVPFIDWKRQKGFDVIVGFTDDPAIGTTTTSIRNYIHNYYNDCTGTPDNPKPSFVLLVGDNNLIPAFTGSAGMHITDLNYVSVTEDIFPEIYFGRFSARNTAQLQPQIDKTLEYERYEMPDPSYLGEAVMIAGVDPNMSPVWANGQINYGTTYYFNAAHGITSHTYLYPASASNAGRIIQDVSDGVGYANYTAHGSETSWADPSFDVSDVNGLTNAHKYGTVVGNCCVSNSYQVETCFGEAWLRAVDKGSIGYIGGANNTYWDEDYWWGVGSGTVVVDPTYENTGPGAYDGMFHDNGEEFPSWYTCQYSFIMAGNLAVTEAGGAFDYYWEIYCLMGDPSVSTYFGVPSANEITHTNQLFVGASTMNIQADPYSYVGLNLDGEQLDGGLVDETGEVTLNFAPLSSVGTASLVITRQNRIPYIAEIDVIPNDGPYVVLSNCTPETAQYGQTVSLNITLQNVGTETADNVAATLTLTDPYVTILDGTAPFGTIASNVTSTVNNAFSIQIPSFVPDEYELSFTLTITGAAGGEWIYELEVVLQSPVLTTGDLVVNDNAGGNNNGRLDPGETAIISVPIINEGHALSPAATATLTTASPWITITDNTEALGSISVEGVEDAVFSVMASQDAPNGVPAFVTCSVDAGEYDASESFMLQIGLDVEDFETGGFTNYPWIMDASAPWTINSTAPYEGSNSAESGSINHGQSTSLSVFTEWVEDGSISFCYKVSSESGYDFLRFFIDGVEIESWSGEVSWTQATFPITMGGHTFQWQYEKDYSEDGGGDCAWLDYIVFPPFGNPRYPDIAWTPDTFEHEQQQNAVATEILTVSNVGEYELTYEAVVYTVCGASTSGPAMKLAKGETDPRVNSPSLDDNGGPDGFGHLWVDSDSPGGPEFEWVEISAIGTPIPSVDDTTIGSLDLGFTFSFYNIDFTTVNICSNGWISFTAMQESFENLEIPNGGDPDNFIAPFWDDLNPEDGGTIYYYADAANHRFIVQWDEILHWGTEPSESFTYEVILHEDGRIVLQYLEMLGDVRSGTIGIESFNGTDGLEIAFNQDYAHENLAIEINKPCGWLSINPNHGSILPNAPVNSLTLEFNSSGLAVGTYNANVWINSNDPDESSVVVPVSLTVTPLDAPESESSRIPQDFYLAQNYPNPFNPSTSIEFGIPAAANVSIRIYDILGRQVDELLSGSIPAGHHSVKWECGSCSSGLYLIVMETPGFSCAKKAMFLR